MRRRTRSRAWSRLTKLRADYDSREAALREEHMARMAQKEGRAKEAELGTEFVVSEKASKRVQAQLSEEMALNVALEAWGLVPL